MEAEPNDATPFLPDRHDLKALRAAAERCRGCHLWRGATQTVFGEGRRSSRVMLVGEQPGDKEDRAGEPFVGPAGRELDRGLEAAGIARADAYVTNVVKHFKFEERGRRRIHQTPKRFEIDACKPWLEEERRVVKPEALVLLGATAATALLGSSFMRGPDDACHLEEREAFAEDLKVVAQALYYGPGVPGPARRRQAGRRSGGG